MKKRMLYPLMLVFGLGFLVSCGGNDDQPGETSKYVGQWDMVSLQYEGSYKAYQGNELLDEGEFAGQAKDITMVWEFLANEVKATGGFNMTMEYGWTPGVEFTYPVAAATYEGSWSVDGSKMTFHFKTGEVSEANIISETEDTLVLSLPQTLKQSGFGGENVFTMVNTMTLKRK
ncbi:lipocalin family protein [Algoriphagus terrigena]|uniref:lipocalin family protein n=1 Tax=Algoriphagus terrigena TaxID=344884 RepID=UPI00040B4252|nr:lipocalin family protein [Algoriphagus terrigena]